MNNSDTSVPKRPVPAQGIYVDTSPFWRGLDEGRLVLQYCPATKRYQHPPRPVSTAVSRRALEWRELSGKGTIYAYTVVRIPGPGLQDRVPLPVATVELDEGVRILANLLHCTPDEPAIGMRVKLVMDMLDEAQPYPAFALVR